MKLFLAGAIAAALTAGGSAHAATVVFAGQDVNPGPARSVATNPNADAANANFQSFLDGVSTEGFEGFATNTAAPINLSFTGSAGTLNASLTGTGSVRSSTRAAPTSSGQYAVAGSNYYYINGTAFNVSFATPIAAFGFYAADLEYLNNINVTLNYAAGGSSVYNLGTIYGLPTGVQNSGSVHFLGFIDATNPFSSVRFSSSTPAGSDFLAFDQLTIGDVAQVVAPPGVPEPTTWAMLILGFLGTGAAMRSRKTRPALRYV